MLRKQLKQDSHFLVKYVCDDNLQIRTRSFFKTDSKIDIMGLYEVQWGRSDDVDSALVIASGDYDSIRALYQEKIRDITANESNVNSTPSTPRSCPASPQSPRLQPSPKSPTPPQSPKSPTPPSSPPSTPSSPSSPLLLQPPAKRQRRQRPSASPASPQQPPRKRQRVAKPKKITVAKQEARVIGRGNAPPRRPPTDDTNNDTNDVGTPTRESRESTPLRPISLETPERPAVDTPAPATDATTENDTPTLDKSLPLVVNRFEKTVINMLTKLNAKIDALSRRQNNVENIVTELKKASDRRAAQREDVPVALSQRDVSSSETTSSIDTENIPPEYSITTESLRNIRQSASGAGNFGLKLVKKLFPELFGPENLRFQYNWYGGGQNNKKRLDPQRTEIIRGYIMIFYPEVRDSDMFKRTVVNSVNEGLRRPIDKRDRSDRSLRRAALCAKSANVTQSVPPAKKDLTFAFNDEGDLVEYQNL